MKQIYLLFLLLVSSQSFGQEHRVKISGEIKSDSIYIDGAHIINLNSKKGTVSNHLGLFKINAKLYDTIQISEISYKTKTIIIDESYTNTGILIVNLEVKVNELDEVIINESQAINGINATSLNLPNAGKTPLNKNERNLNYYSQESVPIVILMALIGKSGGIDDIYNVVSGNRKKHRKLKKLTDQDKLIEFNQQAVQKIRKHFKDDFFIKSLDLSKANIDLYIQFCLKKNIIQYFNDQRYIEVIDVFVKEIDNFNSELHKEIKYKTGE